MISSDFQRIFVFYWYLYVTRCYRFTVSHKQGSVEGYNSKSITKNRHTYFSCLAGGWIRRVKASVYYGDVITI